MKTILLLVAMVFCGTAQAARFGDLHDPFYIVAVSTNINVTDAATLQGAVYFGADNWKSTMAVNGVLTVQSGVVTTTGTFSGAVAITGQATFDGAANHVATISARGVISGDQVNSVFGVSAATGAFTGAVSVTGQATFNGTGMHVATITTRGVVSADQFNSVFGVSAATASISGLTSLSSATFTGGLVLPLWTIAQFDTLTPTASGQLFLCSDCAGKPTVVSAFAMSTGTTTGAFVDASSTSVHVGTAH